MALKFPPRSLMAQRSVVFDGFRGVNLADDPTQLEAGFSPWCRDLIFDSQGRMRRRPNWRTTGTGGGALPASLSSLKTIFYWPSKDKVVYQEGTALKSQPYPSGAITTIHTFSTSAAVAMVAFNGNLVIVHPVDGVSDYDGTTWTSRSATVKGSCIAAWQNKLWVGGDTSNRSRVWWSNAGSSATWTTGTDFVDLRELNDDLITAIGGGNGMDIAGRPGLVVFKATSWYRINSSTNGSYTTLDDRAGAVGPNAVSSTQSHLAAIGPDGVYLSDGVNQPTRISRLVDPLFKRSWNAATLPMTDVTATVRGGLFLFCRGTTNASGAVATFDPVLGVWATESYPFDGATIYAPTSDATRTPLIFDNVNGTIWQATTGDTATYTDPFGAVLCEWLSPWVEPFPGRSCRLQTARVSGNWTSASVKLQTFKDQLATATDYALAAKAVDATHEGYTTTLHDLGVANMWQVAIRETTGGSGSAAWTDAFSERDSLGLSTQPPFQISRISTDFLMQGLSS